MAVALPGRGTLGADFDLWYRTSDDAGAVQLICDGAAAAADQAEAAKASGTNVSPDAKAFIVTWLQEKYGVSLN